jgi:hypothetical protein
MTLQLMIVIVIQNQKTLFANTALMTDGLKPQLSNVMISVRLVLDVLFGRFQSGQPFAQAAVGKMANVLALAVVQFYLHPVLLQRFCVRVHRFVM